MENWPSRLQTAVCFGFPFLVCGPLRLELSHPPHAPIRVSLCFSLASSLAILASTMLSRKNVDLGGWQLVQCTGAALLEDIPMASVWAFYFPKTWPERGSQGLRLSLRTHVKSGSHFTQCCFPLHRGKSLHQTPDFEGGTTPLSLAGLKRCLLKNCGLRLWLLPASPLPTIWSFFLS